MSKRRVIWVIEVYRPIPQRWETIYGTVTRNEARSVMREWRVKFSRRKFRIVPYAPASRHWE